MKEQEENKSFEVQSEGVQDAGILALRLETERLVNRFRVYLTGKIIETTYDEETGEPRSTELTIAKPKANAQGVHFLLNFFESIVNPQTVQGNLINEDRYDSIVKEIHLGLIQDIVNNMYLWDIKEDEVEPLINNVINIRVKLNSFYYTLQPTLQVQLLFLYLLLFLYYIFLQVEIH